MRKLSGVALIVLVGLAVAAAAGDPQPDAEPSAPSILFVIPVDYPGQLENSLGVAESIRRHGGSLAKAPIRIYTPRS